MRQPIDLFCGCFWWLSR